MGSSNNLNDRLIDYFNTNYLLRNTSMYICQALFKDGYSNFSLIILEYCEPSQCLIREKHSWDIFKPEYNIAQDPTAPMSGRKHSDKTKKILSDAKKIENPGRFKTGENHPMYGKNHTEETKTKISDTKKGQPKPEGAGSPSQAIEVTDITNDITTSYDSISEAARALNIHPAHIVMYFSRNQKKNLIKVSILSISYNYFSSTCV